MRKSYRYLILGLAGLLLVPLAASAHTYRADGPIRVLLHTDPDDDPVTHEPTQLNFYVFDDTNQFLGSHCICTVTVSGNGKTILKQAAFTDKNADKNEAALPVVFPQLGLYTVTLAAQPKPGTSFHAFSLDYPVRVAQEGKTSTSAIRAGSLLANGAKLAGIYVLAAGVIIGIIAVSARNERKRRAGSALSRTERPRKN